MKWAQDKSKLALYDELLAKGRVREEDQCPDVEPFSFYIEAFSELSSCRPVGMGVGPIPFSSIVQYATIYEIEDFEDFKFVIRQMDDAYISTQSKTDGNTNSSSGNKNKNRHAGRSRS